MKVLVVVDMQKDFVDGALGTAEAVEIVPKVAEKIRAHEGLIALTYDTHHADYLSTQEGRNLPVEHCIEGTEGWELNGEIARAISEKCPESGCKVFRKPGFGSVELAEWLRELAGERDIEEIELIGLCTDICVISNAMLIKAAVPETLIKVDASCCAGVSPLSHTNALEAMKMCQISIENA